MTSQCYYIPFSLGFPQLINPSQPQYGHFYKIFFCKTLKEATQAEKKVTHVNDKDPVYYKGDLLNFVYAILQKTKEKRQIKMLKKDVIGEYLTKSRENEEKEYENLARHKNIYKVK
jgi:hypothetical protein